MSNLVEISKPSDLSHLENWLRNSPAWHDAICALKLRAVSARLHQLAIDDTVTNSEIISEIFAKIRFVEALFERAEA